MLRATVSQESRLRNLSNLRSEACPEPQEEVQTELIFPVVLLMWDDSRPYYHRAAKLRKSRLSDLEAW